MPDLQGLEGLLVTGIFVGVVACVLGYTQVLAPRRQGRRLAEALLAAGWVPLDPSSDEAVGLVERVAVEGPLGAHWEATYAERLGPVTSQVRVSKSTRGASERVFRDPSSTRPRYAGIASTTQTARSKSSLDLGQTRMAMGRILWIGEARRLPVEKLETIVSGLGQVLGRQPGALPRAAAWRRHRDSRSRKRPSTRSRTACAR